MLRFLKIYLVLYLVFSVSIGVTFSLNDFINNKPLFSFTLIKFTFLGALVFVFPILVYHFYKLKINKFKINKKNLSVKQKEVIVCNVSIDKLYDRLIFLKDRYYVTKENEILFIKTGMWKMSSLGEIITIKYENTQVPGKYKVTILSRPNSLMAFIDFGKNLENVYFIKNLLSTIEV